MGASRSIQSISRHQAAWCMCWCLIESGLQCFPGGHKAEKLKSNINTPCLSQSIPSVNKLAFAPARGVTVCLVRGYIPAEETYPKSTRSSIVTEDHTPFFMYHHVLNKIWTHDYQQPRAKSPTNVSTGYITIRKSTHPPNVNLVDLLMFPIKDSGCLLIKNGKWYSVSLLLRMQ